MKRLQRLIVVVGAVVAVGGTMAAQPVVVTGTGNPDVDVPAVQAAVDQGGHVVLMGHFSFDRPPTKWLDHLYGRTVLVSKQVAISGTTDENGGMTTIEGGDNPFAIDAVGAHVTIQRLRFVRPKENAIVVIAVSGLVIANCRIDGVEPLPDPTNPTGAKFASAISVITTANLLAPSATQPGQPEKVSGRLLIFDNDMNVGGGAGNTLGIVMFAVGKSPNQEVDIYVSGNNISNVTEPAINFRVVGGRVNIERNRISTGAVAAGLADAIRIVGAGSYLIAHNSIDCGWANGAVTGVNLLGPPPPLTPEARAIVFDNDVTMSAPEGTVFPTNNSAILITGFAQGNALLNNRIRGRARAALTVVRRESQGVTGIPGGNTFVSNDLDGFQSSLADVLIDTGVTNTTLVVGSQTSVEDHGAGTVIVRTP